MQFTSIILLAFAYTLGLAASPSPARPAEVKKFGLPLATRTGNLPANYDALPNASNFIPLDKVTASAPIYTPLACMDEPTIVFPNGSNSTYLCWLSQFPSFDTDRPNALIDECKGANDGKCFLIGNDRRTSPTLQHDYFLVSANQQTVARPPRRGFEPVWKRVYLGHGNYGLSFYQDGTCLDAYWDDQVLKVHQWGCHYNNRNQWWRYSMHSDLQLFQHAVYTDWCLQTNGVGIHSHSQMVKCSWAIQEQQRRLYF
ncbi:hypothetical protein DYB37_012661 [Aphanomyces astaci]|uniref:Uncharacterized protein n=1 Tax=Aphanomyces astaci TaxID=112090 RepID=A0A3R7APZ9_APHAT|nr:hypothetical protein DYB37_012661 [Aphanomyces astaci]